MACSKNGVVPVGAANFGQVRAPVFWACGASFLLLEGTTSLVVTNNA